MTTTPSLADSQDLEGYRRAVQRLSTLLDLSRALGSELELDRLLRTIMARATEVLNADRSSLFLVDYASDQLWSRVAQGEGITEIRFPRAAGIAGHVATTGETLNIPDAYADPRFNQEVDRQTGYRTRTILCMPIRDVSGEIIAVIEVLNRQDGVFTPEDEALLAAVGAQAGIALANASLMEARRKEAAKSNLLLEVMRALASELGLDQLLARIMAKTTEVLQADRSSLFLVDHKTNELWFKVAQGTELREVRIPVGVGIAGYAAATGEILNIPDAYADPRFNPEVDRRTGYRTRTILCVPFRDATGTTVGVLQVLNKKHGLFTHDDEELLLAIGAQATIALRNASLFEETVRIKNYRESILRSMATGVATLDMEARITTANPATERILRFTDGTPLGVRFDQAISAEQNHELWDVVQTALERGESHRAEKLRYVAASGDKVTMNLSAVPLLDHRAAQIGLVLVIEDVSREQQLVGTLSRVLSRQVAEQLLASGLVLSVGGERKRVTVLISDIRNFTVMAESADPEEVVAMLNDYFARMIHIIFQYEGTLDKFMGDAVMAVFGTPVAHQDDALRAACTAIEMRQALRQFNVERRAQGKAAIEIGIGICNGEAVSGAIGSEERMEFTVIGDTVNTAVGLEALTKGFPEHKILFNEPVYEALRERLPCDFLGQVKIKGRLQAVKVYGVPEPLVHSVAASTLRL
ncbi:MAG: GAF domain-containing protein [Chloroflexi bacterium]|nr:GAF domain-containing protein [Chloroflexota bacterium]